MPANETQTDDDREDEGARGSNRGEERQSRSEKSGGGNDYVCSGQRRRQRGKRLRSSPRGSSLASVILGPFTQSPLLQGFPSPHGHHYKMEQLHLIRLQRVASLPHPKTSEKRRLQVTQRSGRDFKEMQNYSAISWSHHRTAVKPGNHLTQRGRFKGVKTEKQSGRNKNISTAAD